MFVEHLAPAPVGRGVGQHVERKADVGRAGPGRIEREVGELERGRERGLVAQGPVQDRLAVGRGADREIRAAAVDLDPVRLGIDQIDEGLAVLGQLACHDGVQVEAEIGRLQGLAVLFGDLAQGLAIGLHGVEHGPAVALLADRPIEIGQGLVPKRAQPGGHDQDPRAAGAMERDLADVGHLAAAGDAAVGQANQAVPHLYGQTIGQLAATPRRWESRPKSGTPGRVRQAALGRKGSLRAHSGAMLQRTKFP